MVRARLILLLSAGLCAGCTADGQGLGDGGVVDRGFATDSGVEQEPDTGPAPTWALGLVCEAQGRTIPYGMEFADGCNECGCGPVSIPSPFSCDGGTCQWGCTSAACAADVGPRTCATSTDCGGGVCFFDPGCGPPSGHCAYVQTRCRPPAVEWTPSAVTPPMLLCGCDGKTYEGPCPMVPYAHTGPCP